jgi:hypothetical protein
MTANLDCSPKIVGAFSEEVALIMVDSEKPVSLLQNFNVDLKYRVHSQALLSRD